MSEYGSWTGTKLIIADDEEFIRHHLAKRFTDMGFTVLEASSGSQVLELLACSPDLILMDVRMPEIDGYETTRQIRSGRKSSRIPVILLSALSGEADIEYGLKSGADEFLCKPVTFAVIMESISRKLVSHRLP